MALTFKLFTIFTLPQKISIKNTTHHFKLVFALDLSSLFRSLANSRVSLKYMHVESH